MKVPALLRSNPWLYWRTLLQLLSNVQTVRQYLDVPLQDAIFRSQWFTIWSTTLFGTSILLRHQGMVQQWTATLLRTATSAVLPYTVLVDAAFLVLFAAAGYGFLRLYTLVGHVLTINVFKTRGQRLRLLNVETTLLTLTAPMSAAYILFAVFPAAGWTLASVASLYGLVQLAYAYNLIFHKRRLGGLGLLVGATLVTWFVLAIGALAIAVTFAVVSFFVLAFLRLFMHH